MYRIDITIKKVVFISFDLPKKFWTPESTGKEAHGLHAPLLASEAEAPLSKWAGHMPRADW